MLNNADTITSNPTKRISLLLTGNIPCQTSLISEKERFGEAALTYPSCFSPLKTVIDKADLTIGSLDAAYAYPDDFIKALKSTGFDMLTIGVDPKGNKNRRAISSSLDAHLLHRPKGKLVGTTVIDMEGIRIGVIDCTFHYPYKDMNILSEVLSKVEKMAKKRVDFKLCYVHWQFFIDSMLAVDERQRVVAKALANAGVDYIVGAGPRYLMRYETLNSNWNRKVPVAYSLGNLLYCSNQLNQNTSAILKLDLTKDENGKVTVSDSYLPCYTWTVLGDKRRRVQFLNDREYLYKSTNDLAEWRKLFAANRLGPGILPCREFDVNKAADEYTASTTELADDYTRRRLSEPGDLQKMILDAYRLTDGFRAVYGKQLYSSDRYRPIIQGTEHFLRCKYPHILEQEDAKDIIVDMIYSKNVLGFDYNEYFGFHLRERSIPERTDFISDLYRLNYYRQLNTDYKANHQLDNKWACYEKIPKLFKRKVINVADATCRDQFVAFANEFDRFIIKPVNGTLGQGIRIIGREDYADVNVLFDELLDKAGPFICEELIVSKKYLSDLHPESCNSIRIFTYNSGSDIRFLCAWLKAGTGSAIVDNGGAGGVVAAINMETGIVDYDAANEAGVSFECHPDSGIPFKGFQIQDWTALKKMAKKAATAFPKVRLIAWDIAHGEKGWQLIEGNSQGQMWIYQLSSGKGMRKDMEELLGW